MNILIYGFGRMGLTHYSIINSLIKADFTFIEPNKKLNYLLRTNIKANFLSKESKLDSNFDLTLVTAPPFTHQNIVNSSINRGDKQIFVEKPFGGYLNYNSRSYESRVYIGYVLRYNPIISWVKENIDPDEVSEISASYFSNTIENKPKGWRNTKFSGVLNEMGSHVIDLSNYLFDLSKFEVKSSKVVSHISDIDDEVSAEILSGTRMIKFHFNWVNKKIRKPIFQFNIKTINGDIIIFDQQKIEIIRKNSSKKYISVVDINKKVPYYLRGVDFTNQMLDLIGDRKKMCSAKEAFLVNKIMSEIIRK